MAFRIDKHAPPTAAKATCFLCGEEVEAKDLAQEHVFPKWLQRDLALWDNEIVLLNGTRIAYRNLKIPACKPCNTVYLSSIENQLSRAASKGADSVRQLGHQVLFLWLAKIFFGILYAESLLPMNRAAHEQGPIVREGALEEFRFLHFTMQAARTEIEFTGFDGPFHCSIFVFPIQEHPDASKRFMYRDDVEHGCLSIRLNTVGLILVTDGGAQERLAEEVFPKLFHHPLHPLQFEEIAAKIFMKARTLTRVPKFITSQGPDGVRIIQMPLGGLSDSPIFGDYDHELYARMLAEFTSHPLHLIWPGDGSVQTWIRSYREPHFIDVREQPWP